MTVLAPTPRVAVTIMLSFLAHGSSAKQTFGAAVGGGGRSLEDAPSALSDGTFNTLNTGTIRPASSAPSEAPRGGGFAVRKSAWTEATSASTLLGDSDMWGGYGGGSTSVLRGGRGSSGCTAAAAGVSMAVFDTEPSPPTAADLEAGHQRPTVHVHVLMTERGGQRSVIRETPVEVEAEAQRIEEEEAQILAADSIQHMRGVAQEVEAARNVARVSESAADAQLTKEKAEAVVTDAEAAAEAATAATAAAVELEAAAEADEATEAPGEEEDEATDEEAEEAADEADEEVGTGVGESAEVVSADGGGGNGGGGGSGGGGADDEDAAEASPSEAGATLEQVRLIASDCV